MHTFQALKVNLLSLANVVCGNVFLPRSIYKLLEQLGKTVANKAKL